MSRWVIPNGASASTTAFTITGGIPIVPASPIPLTPSGLFGDGRQPLTAIRELGHARPRHVPSRRADDAEAAVDRDDILWTRLEHAGRELSRLFLHVARRERKRRTAERGAPAAERADPLRRA